MLVGMQPFSSAFRRLTAAGALVVLLVFAGSSPVWAADAFPDQQTNGSIGLQGTISATPPTRAATIATPGNGTTFTNVPITVTGLCPSNVLVKVFDNNVFMGSAFCASGSYSIQINLFSGQNQLVTKVYDALDQAGPDSNTINVTFNDAQFAEFGTHVSLSSAYAQRGAPPGQELQWPVILSGGVGPYAVSVDWGDGTATDLFSQASPGTLALKHSYKTAGIYKIIVKATDKNGGTAFLQLTGQATGAAQTNPKGGSGGATVKVQMLWWPPLAMVPMLFVSFWIGRRHELFSLRKQLEKSRDSEGN